MAGAIDICSNHYLIAFTPDQLRRLAILGDTNDGSSEAPLYRLQALPKRLGAKNVEEIVQRYQSGESAQSLAKEHKVAPSALIRLLRENNVVVRRLKVSADQEQLLAREYEAGATIRELEKKLGLSHGAVLRALHRVGVEMRPKAPRKRS